MGSHARALSSADSTGRPLGPRLDRERPQPGGDGVINQALWARAERLRIAFDASRAHRAALAERRAHMDPSLVGRALQPSLTTVGGVGPTREVRHDGES